MYKEWFTDKKTGLLIDNNVPDRLAIINPRYGVMAMDYSIPHTLADRDKLIHSQPVAFTMKELQQTKTAARISYTETI